MPSAETIARRSIANGRKTYEMSCKVFQWIIQFEASLDRSLFVPLLVDERWSHEARKVTKWRTQRAKWMLIMTYEIRLLRCLECLTENYIICDINKLSSLSWIWARPLIDYTLQFSFVYELFRNSHSFNQLNYFARTHRWLPPNGSLNL